MGHLSSWINLIGSIFIVQCDQFHESLLLRPLEDGSLFAEFKFNVITRHSDLADLFYESFPKSIGELFVRLPLWQFDLTLTRGRWDAANWGLFHPNIAPMGSELRAVFYDVDGRPTRSDSHHIDDWLSLQQILSGLYCASINEIHVQTVNATKYPFTPSELQWLNALSDHRWSHFHGVSPRETICTENLTPWSKQLPCRRNGGLSLLLNPQRLFSAKYQSLQVHVAPLGEDEFMKMTQSFQVVLSMKDSAEIMENVKSPKRWDIHRLFGVTVDHMPSLKGCPVADSSLILFEVPLWAHSQIASWRVQDDGTVDALKPSPARIYAVDGGDSYLLLYSMDRKLKGISMQWPLGMFGHHRLGSGQRAGMSMDNLLKTERYLIEDNLVSGQLVISITNQHPTRSVRFSYFDPLPRFLKLYFETMEMRVDGQRVDPFRDLEHFQISLSEHEREYGVERIRNEHPVVMEWVTTLSAQSVLSFRMEIDKTFLHFESYPPDYNRGFDVGNGIVRILDPLFDAMDYHNLFVFGDEEGRGRGGNESILSLDRYRRASRIVLSPQMLVLLPYPDMSMVFNVIAFSSTLFAFFFGSSFNNLYRNEQDLDKKNIQRLKEAAQWIWAKIAGKCRTKRAGKLKRE